MKKIFCALLIISCLLLFYCWKQESYGLYVGDEVIRLHILANSNNPYDQALKYEIRDEIIKMISPLFSGNESKGEAYKIIYQNQDKIIALVKNMIKKAGYSYSVDIAIGKYDFPDRAYEIKNADKKEKIIFPEGEYEAVRVILGEGVGNNWWCVLFPPLCFVGDENKEDNVEKNYSLEKENVVYKSKLGEIFQDIKAWF